MFEADEFNVGKNLLIHRAPLGTRSCFIGFLIASRRCGTSSFPLWLAPEQIRVLTIGGDGDPAAAGLVNYARRIVNELRANFVRGEADYSTNKMNSDKSRAGGKIQDAEIANIHPAERDSPSAAATWTPATFRSACTAKATSGRNPELK